jgi:hypothetical protein
MARLVLNKFLFVFYRVDRITLLKILFQNAGILDPLEEYWHGSVTDTGIFPVPDPNLNIYVYSVPVPMIFRA